MANFHLCGPNLAQYLFDYKRHAFGMTVTGVGTGVTEGEGTLKFVCNVVTKSNANKLMVALIHNVHVVTGVSICGLSLSALLNNTELLRGMHILKQESSGKFNQALVLSNDDVIPLDDRDGLSFIKATLVHPSIDIDKVVNGKEHTNMIVYQAVHSSCPVFISRAIQVPSLEVYQSTRKSRKCNEAFIHSVLGHPSPKVMRKIKQLKPFIGLEWDDKKHTGRNCIPCAIGNSRRSDKRYSDMTATARGELIFSDIQTVTIPTFWGCNFAVHFTDCFSKASFVYLLFRKSDVAKSMNEFVQFAARLGITIKKFHTDAENVYIGDDSDFKKSVTAMNIGLSNSAPYCHWQNGVVERMIMTLLRRAFIMIAQSNCPNELWGAALQYAAMCTNCLPTASIKWQTTYELWFNKHPNFEYFQVFGCKAVANVDIDNRQNFVKPPAIYGTFIGLESYEAMSTYKVLEYTGGGLGEVLKRGDVKFFQQLDPDNFLNRVLNDTVMQEYIDAADYIKISKPSQEIMVQDEPTKATQSADNYDFSDALDSQISQDELGEAEETVALSKMDKPMLHSSPRDKFQSPISLSECPPSNVQVITIYDHSGYHFTKNTDIAVVRAKISIFTNRASGKKQFTVGWYKLSDLKSKSSADTIIGNWARVVNYIKKYTGNDFDDVLFHTYKG